MVNDEDDRLLLFIIVRPSVHERNNQKVSERERMEQKKTKIFIRKVSKHLSRKNEKKNEKKLLEKYK